MIRRRKPPRERTRFSRLDQENLLLAIESSLSRTAQCFSKLTDRSIDMDWLLSEMERQTEAGLLAIRELQHRRSDVDV